MRTEFNLIVILLILSTSLMAITAEEYLKLGIDYYNHNALPLSKHCFEMALELDSSLTEAKQNIGVIHYCNGDDSLAIMMFRDALRDTAYQDRSMIHVFLGIIYIIPNELPMNGVSIETALHEFDSAIMIDPGFTQAYYWKGKAAELIPDIDRAMEYYSEAIKLDSNYAEAFNQLGVLYYLKDIYWKSADNFKSALSCKDVTINSRSIFYYNLGTVYYAEGRYTDGKNAMDKAKELNSRLNTPNPQHLTKIEISRK